MSDTPQEPPPDDRPPIDQPDSVWAAIEARRRTDPRVMQIEKDGRRCEGCGVVLPPFWPAVYCSNRCAWNDA